jgi:hypothetical protein
METERGTTPKFDWLPFAGDLPRTAQTRLPSKSGNALLDHQIDGDVLVLLRLLILLFGKGRIFDEVERVRH